MSANVNDRERNILALLAEEDAISVQGLAEALKVSAVTIRSHLNTLAEKGFVVRTWGGALPAFHPVVLERQRKMVDEKNRIAKAAAALVADGDTIMIEAGTTTALIAKYLLGKRDVVVVTNSTLVVPYARSNPSIHLTLVGGSFRPATESLVGPVALEELERYHVSKAFVGTDGFGPDSGLSTHLVEGAEIVKKMAARAQETILVADSSKYGRRGFVRVLPLSCISRIIVDSGLDEEPRERLRESGPAIQIV